MKSPNELRERVDKLYTLAFNIIEMGNELTEEITRLTNEIDSLEVNDDVETPPTDNILEFSKIVEAKETGLITGFIGKLSALN
jgi:hypothetical protein